jgi:hypothetical protein
MSDIERVHELSQRLIHDGYVDNEPDARLMAIRILVAVEMFPPIEQARDADD